MLLNDSEMQAELENRTNAVENRLECCFKERVSYGTLLESMRYTLLAGGKRIRAVLCLAFCAAVSDNETKALDAACAIEMLHAYSLIHDDLPCMDDDDTRRGKPSNHIAFGECTATLAGDALQAAAFEMMLSSKLPAETVVKMTGVLADAAGAHGICGGQFLDMKAEGKSLPAEEIFEIHRRKTAALLSAAAQIGVLAGGGTAEQLSGAEDYANAIGLAFQIRDDVLNVMSDSESLGKPSGTDKERGKVTFASALGIDECKRIISEQTRRAVAAIDDKFEKTRFLVWFARMLEERKS